MGFSERETEERRADLNRGWSALAGLGVHSPMFYAERPTTRYLAGLDEVLCGVLQVDGSVPTRCCLSDSAATETTHHLMRVRVRNKTFERLQEIAQVESARSGEHTSVSDLVRAALADYINVYDSTSKLTSLLSDPARKPVG